MEYDEIEKREIEDMLKGRIINAFHGPWGFLVVISQKINGCPRLDYPAPNKRMKADKSPMLKVD